MSGQSSYVMLRSYLYVLTVGLCQVKCFSLGCELFVAKCRRARSGTTREPSPAPRLERLGCASTLAERQCHRKSSVLRPHSYAKSRHVQTLKV